MFSPNTNSKMIFLSLLKTMSFNMIKSMNELGTAEGPFLHHIKNMFLQFGHSFLFFYFNY